MILQELVNYYERMAKLEDSNIAPIGLEWKEISFAIVIDKEGRFLDIDDLRTEGKKPRGRACLVPQGETRTVHQAPPDRKVRGMEVGASGVHVYCEVHVPRAPSRGD